MSNDPTMTPRAVIVETELLLSLQELSRACGSDMALIESLVQEGVLTAQGESPAEWRFEGSVLPRARKATRISVQLDLGASGAALVLELLEEIDALRAELRHLQR